MSVSYSEMVAALVKPGVDIIREATPEKFNLLHMAIGISGEAGELLDAVKKAVIYNKQLDMDNMIEELGDLEFYMEGVRQAIGVSRDKCLEANTKKLMIRYNGKYSNQAAQNRADKA